MPKPDIGIGDLVYLHSDRNKSRSRSRYLVVSIEQDWCSVRKFTRTQLRSMSYRVKRTECYKVPHYDILTEESHDTDRESDDDDHNDIAVDMPRPPALPGIPQPIGPQPPLHQEDEGSTPATVDPIDTSEVCPSKDEEPNDITATVDQYVQPLRRSTRLRRVPKQLQDFCK
jgi:hypothetical protein